MWGIHPLERLYLEESRKGLLSLSRLRVVHVGSSLAMGEEVVAVTIPPACKVGSPDEGPSFQNASHGKVY